MNKHKPESADKYDTLAYTLHRCSARLAVRSSFNDGGRRQRHSSGGTLRGTRCVSK